MKSIINKQTLVVTFVAVCTSLILMEIVGNMVATIF